MSEPRVGANSVVDIIVRDGDAVVLLGDSATSRLLRISEVANVAFHTVRDCAGQGARSGMPLSDLVASLTARFGMPEEGAPTAVVRELVDQLVDVDLLEWIRD